MRLSEQPCGRSEYTYIACQGERHVIALSRKGKFMLLNHTREELRQEFALARLAGPSVLCECAKFLRGWRSVSRWQHDNKNRGYPLSVAARRYYFPFRKLVFCSRSCGYNRSSFPVSILERPGASPSLKGAMVTVPSLDNMRRAYVLIRQIHLPWHPTAYYVAPLQVDSLYSAVRGICCCYYLHSPAATVPRPSGTRLGCGLIRLGGVHSHKPIWTEIRRIF